MKKHAIHQKGFTLLELLVVIAVIGILASLSVVSYRSHIVQSNRQAGQASLLLAQQAMERSFLRTGAYTLVNADLAPFEPSVTPQVYTLNVVIGKVSGYTLTATPVGSQAADAACGALSITNTGIKSAAVAANTFMCWR